MRVARFIVVGFAAAFMPVLWAQEHEHAATQGEKLGTVQFSTSCSEAAQPSFNRAVALLHSFEFGPAIEAFTATLGIDSSCGMTQWGVALARWGNPFGVGTRPTAQLDLGQQAVDRARAVGVKTPREQLYVDAVALLYADTNAKPQQMRIAAYRDAMEKLTVTYPDDMEAKVFFALSLTASEDPSDKTYANRLRAVAILQPLFAQHPDHPGLAHYIIHSDDVPALAPNGLDAARRYAAIAPSAPHALHMPSHIFTRVGSWQESIDTNIASVAASQRENAPGEELHASDYLMYAYLQTAQDAKAKSVMGTLPDITRRLGGGAASAAPPSAGAFALAAIPARWALERGAWHEAAELEVHPSAIPYADALTQFARALGAARSGDPGTARTAIAELGKLRDRESQLNEPYWVDQIDIQRQSAEAWLAFFEGRIAEAVAGQRAAAQAEDRTEKAAITPGPLAPARELLGEMLVLDGQPSMALAEFEATLVKEPNRFRALAGAMAAANQAGNKAKAQTYAAALLKVCARSEGPARPELTAARTLISSR